MRFAQKLACMIVLVLAVAFSLGGSILLHGNFADALQNAEQQNEAQHALACYSLESGMLARHSRGDAVDDSFLKQHVSGTHSAVGKHAAYSAVYRFQGLRIDTPETLTRWMESEVYSTLPLAIVPIVAQLEDGKMRYVKTNESVYAVYKTTMIESTAFVSAFNVSEIYAVRARSVQRFLWMEAAVLSCAAVAAVLLARWLTKPLSTLAVVSMDIANGAYEKRTCIQTQDEIGALSNSFDAMAESVEKTVHALETSIQQRDDFMGAFTHELKTPMTAIIGYADTLRSMQCDPEMQKMAASYIFGEAKRVEILSQKLLQLLELSDHPVQMAPVSLHAVLSCVKKASAPWWGDVAVSIAPCSEVLLIYAEENLLIDMLYNLLHNAVKACDGKGAVCIAYTQGKTSVQLTVQDNGRGIPTHLVKRVTEPFFMVDKSRARRSGGSGIGLALCSKIAVLHGTKLTIESNEQKGTIVAVTLPLVAPVQAKNKSREGRKGRATQGKMQSENFCKDTK